MERLRPAFIRPLEIFLRFDDPPSDEMSIPGEYHALPIPNVRSNTSEKPTMERETERKKSRSRARFDSSQAEFHSFSNESPEKMSPRRYQPNQSQKRKTLPPLAASVPIGSTVVSNRPDKDMIKRELNQEWQKEKDIVERYVKSSRCKLKISNKKHPLNKVRKIVNSIIWVNKLCRPTVKKIVNPTIFNREVDEWALCRVVHNSEEAELNVGMIEGPVLSPQIPSGKSKQLEPDFLQESNTLTVQVDRLRQVELFHHCAETYTTNCAQILQQLLNKDINNFIISSQDKKNILNRPDHFGRSPLYLAARNGNIDMVRFLLQRDCFLGPSVGESAIEVASRWNHKAVVEVLLDNKAIVKNISEVRRAYVKAASFEIVQVFVERGYSSSCGACSCTLV